MTPRKRTRISALSTLLALAAVTAPAAAGAQTPAARTHVLRPCVNANLRVSDADRGIAEAAVVCLVNQQRTARGLPALKANTDLDHSAQGWTDRMVADNSFSHGADFSGRIAAAGFKWNAAGENIAAGFTTPFSVVRAWMSDVGHCQNIMRPMFNYVGTGLSVAGNRSGDLQDTWTQDFGRLAGTSTGTSNMGPARGCPYKLSQSTPSPAPQLTPLEPSGSSSPTAEPSVHPTTLTAAGGPTISLG